MLYELVKPSSAKDFGDVTLAWEDEEQERYLLILRSSNESESM